MAKGRGVDPVTRRPETALAPVLALPLCAWRKKESNQMARMKSQAPDRPPMTPELIAPCGMNCRLCRAYGRAKKPCFGCRSAEGFKSSAYLLNCRIRNCEKMVINGLKFCFACDGFACARLKQLDKRYRTRYGMSMIDNLEQIRAAGLRQFLHDETQRWRCAGCGEIICVHKERCVSCGAQWRTRRANEDIY
jgi:hypothetical protein